MVIAPRMRSLGIASLLLATIGPLTTSGVGGREPAAWEIVRACKYHLDVNLYSS